MSSSVHFSDPTKNSSSIPPKSTAIASTQTQSIQTNSMGTDPPKGPERGAQTDPKLLWNSAAAKTIRIDPAVVETILRELERGEREGMLFGAFERRKWGNGMGRRGMDGSGGKVASIRLIKKLDLPKIDTPSPTAALLSIRCGPGQRVALLIGERQHDSAWCAEHLGPQLILVHRKLINSIPLAACPSQVLFGRHGELLILGLQNGEIQLISFSAGSIGELLWTSGGGGGTFHKMAITKMEWAIGGGAAADSVLISAGLDGKLIKSRLEPNNRLEPILSVQIGLADLPARIHRKGAENGGQIGLVDFLQISDQIFVGTETGALLELDSTDLSIKNSMELAENGGGLEQIGTFQVENWQRHLVWRTSDGRIWRRKMQGTAEKEDDGMGQILPIGTSKNWEFCLLKSGASNLAMLIMICDGNSAENEEGRQLICWDLVNDEFMLRDTDIGNQFEGIALASDNSLLAISGDLFARKNGRTNTTAVTPQLNYFQIDIEEPQQ